MEETVTNWLHDYAASELGKGGGEDDDLPPLRLNYPTHYVLHAWADYIRHGIYPKPGGYDAQDVALIRDFSLLTRYYNRIARDMAGNDEQDADNLRELDVGQFVGAIAGVERRDWMDTLGE